ncbi:hypothetical protein E1176_07195 [Fulvivirga sp. RKSG066]|uniref:(4Fe-4S)-binding protein n=1 Tax=Fulvivirga aurantia TaxID=2529383 RepID=UPI0012BD2487|nr:(4Fe-4S)-binding protein [Fulvivirga aurantia]MTI20800.1 hypothetical protein [Fulvivirga aurantia]
MSKEYSNGEVTVVWKPDKCVHSGLCVKGLPKVFKPKEKPWINPEAASTEELTKQIKKCPSGALSYYMNEGHEEPKTDIKMENAKAQVIENGPLMVSGGITVEHADGKTETKKSVAFCRCGYSGNKPYCDGSHTKQGFKG